MINETLARIADRAHETGVIDAAALRALAATLLDDGIGSREEADVLIALDRTAKLAEGVSAQAWSDLFVAVLVDYAVWSARPTGYVDAATARWLVTAVNACGGPTDNARRALAAIVREAQRVDEALLVFVMRGGVMRFRDFLEMQDDAAPGPKRPARAATPAA